MKQPIAIHTLTLLALVCIALTTNVDARTPKVEARIHTATQPQTKKPKKKNHQRNVKQDAKKNKAAKKGVTPYGYDYYTLRGGLDNCRARFEREKKGRVVFLGGSITYGGSWRRQVCRDLQRRFPKTKFDFINAGIPSTGSTPGAFRLVRDVFSRGPVDLLFEEAAVNDNCNYRTATEQLRGMEGIVRHARQINPNLDVVLLHFVDPPKIADYNAGKTPQVIIMHERVAQHYNVPSIDLAKEVTERIRAGEFTWAKDFRNLHPSPFGNRLYAKSISRMLDAAWKKPLNPNTKITPYPMPEKPIDPNSYFRGRLVDIKKAQLDKGWRLDPCWKPKDRAGTRPGFVRVPMLVSTQPGATLTWKFKGTTVGIFAVAGPDAGIVEYSIDGGKFKSQPLRTKWSARLHLPRVYILDGDLPPGKHELTLRVSKTKDKKSRGHAVRIVHLLAN